MFRAPIALVAVAACSIAAAAAQAAPLYTSLTPAGNYATGGAQTFYPSYEYGISFTPTATGKVDTIRVPLMSIGSGPSQMTLTLMTSMDNHPGTALESWVVNPLVNYGVNPNGRMETVTSLTQPTLEAGTQYWLKGTAASGGTVGWFQNAIGLRDNYLWTLDNGATWQKFTPNNLSGAFEVNAVVAPEPTTLAVVASGVSLLLRRRK